jgi:hypothetical protein
MRAIVVYLPGAFAIFSLLPETGRIGPGAEGAPLSGIGGFGLAMTRATPLGDAFG